MTITAPTGRTGLAEAAPATPAPSAPRSRPPWRLPLVFAALASAAAGLVHVAAAGAHGEHAWASSTFAVLAAAQLGWAAAATRRQDALVAGAGVILGAAALAGWLVATRTGIGAIPGLDERADPQWADAFAAGLAATVLAGSAAALGTSRRQPPRPLSRRGRVVLIASAAAIAVALVPTIVAAGGHEHASHGDVAHARGRHGTDAADHLDVVVPPTPYDPTKPIDLGGIEGVTPEQQARAENLVAVTLLRLPQFADHRTAEGAGYRSIGDGITGYEHFVLWSSINDDRILDPDVPESLVYKVEGTTKTLVAAMYMLRDGDTLDNVPDVGGRLTQWHVHDNLCYTPDPEQPLVRGLTDANGQCRPPLVKGRQIPMIHVWIVPHQCGPFAALEGVGAGQIKPGEARWCDHAHGG